MAPRSEKTEMANGNCLQKNSSLSEIPPENPEYSETILQVASKETKTPAKCVPPDGGWGWMVLLGTMTINIVVIGHGKSFGVYFKNLMDEFDASPSRVAWLQSLQIFMFSFLCKYPIFFLLFLWISKEIVDMKRILNPALQCFIS